MVTFTDNLTAGESFTCDISESVDVGSSVTVSLRGPAGYDFTATAITSANAGMFPDSATIGGYFVQQDTTSWPAGAYALTVWLTYQGVRQIVQRGRITISEMPAVGVVTDPTTDAEKMVTAIESHLSSNGSDPTWASYRINNRELRRYSVPELLQLLAYYKRVVVREKRTARGRSEIGPRIGIRI